MWGNTALVADTEATGKCDWPTCMVLRSCHARSSPANLQTCGDTAPMCPALRSVLAAAALWFEESTSLTSANLASDSAMRRRAVELCSRIRFTAVPPHVLLSYHAASKLVQVFDPDKSQIMHAVRGCINKSRAGVAVRSAVGWVPS